MAERGDGTLDIKGQRTTSITVEPPTMTPPPPPRPWATPNARRRAAGLPELTPDRLAELRAEHPDVFLTDADTLARELNAIRSCVNSLEPLDDVTRARVMRYLVARWRP